MSLNAINIALRAPAIVSRAKLLRRRGTKAIRKLKRADPDLEHCMGMREWWELQILKAELEAVRWVLFGAERYDTTPKGEKNGSL